MVLYLTRSIMQLQVVQAGMLLQSRLILSASEQLQDRQSDIEWHPDDGKSSFSIM